jgi:A/G-specific adenine glycosylase
MDSAPLLDWFRPRRRLYPWRRPRPDPYHVLVSEVMLQQTQAARVVPAFRSFIRSFPTVEDLAAAPRRSVLLAWAGLGYNRRAVWLSESARRIVVEHAGEVPARPEVLDRLPGIGPYTAAAIASIAYGMPVPAVDTNVRRVVARAVLGVDGSEPSAWSVREAATAWMDGSDPAAWNQAVMDLGREICRPMPRCERCPLAHSCAFRSSGRTRSPRPRSGGVPFDGSFRQLRGTVIRVLRDRPSATLATLCAASSQPPARVASAVAALQADGLVVAGPGALMGSMRGRVRLIDEAI